MRRREGEHELTDERQARTTDEDMESEWTPLGRRRLLQALGGVAGLTVLGLPEGEAIGVVRAQSDENKQWSQQQKLTANDGDSNDSFGQSVSVSDDGTTALVAAFEDEDPNGEKAGSAYVFSKSGGNWSQQQKLSASDGDVDDGFGVSVSLSADGATALIGAADIDERDDVEAPGSVYVFTESGESWSQQQKLTPDNSNMGDSFGESVSVSDDGTTALIGASGTGSAYIFTESGGSWSQQQKLTPTDGDGSSQFGNSVSLSDGGTTALIGAFGSAFIFMKSGGRWDQQQKLTTTDGSRVYFGSVSIANEGAIAFIGALKGKNQNGDRVGSVYVFTKSGESWSQQQKLSANDGDTGDDFGRAVSVSDNGTTVFIGADGDENQNGDRAGSVYVFTESGGSWSQQQKLSATNGGSTAFFGRSVSVSDDGTTVLIGAPFAETSASSLAGSAYLFTSQESADDDMSNNNVKITNPKIEPNTITTGGSTHTLTFTVENLSPDDNPEEFTITMPDTVAVEGVDIVKSGDLSPESPAVGNPITFSVNSTQTTQAEMEVELTLSPNNG